MSNIDEEAKNNFTIEMRIFFCRMNARDVFILWLLCMLCLGMPLTCVEIFVCVQGFSRQCP